MNIDLSETIKLNTLEDWLQSWNWETFQFDWEKLKIDWDAIFSAVPGFKASDWTSFLSGDLTVIIEKDQFKAGVILIIYVCLFAVMSTLINLI